MPGLVRDTTCYVAWSPALLTAAASMSAAELARADSYPDAASRARFVTGAALLRSLVADLTGVPAADVAVRRRCRWCGGPHGRTELSDGWYASVTHTDGLVGVAVTTAGPLGLDAERVTGTDRSDLLPELLAPGDPVPGDARDLLQLWTVKESVLKATGDGLTRPMTAFRAGDPGRGLDLPATVVELCPAPGYVGALTLLCDTAVHVITRTVGGTGPGSAVAA